MVAVIPSALSNFVLVHDGCVAEIPEMADERGSASIALPLVFAALGLCLNSRSLESLQKVQVVVVHTGRIASYVARVLEHLGVTPVLIALSLPMVLPRLYLGDIIMGGFPAASDRTIPRVPGVSFFNWDHTDQGALAAVIQSPWFVGSTLSTDLLRVLQEVDMHDDGVLNSFTPEQLLSPSFDVSHSLALADDKFYLILGGIGSLGLQIAIWMYRVSNV